MESSAPIPTPRDQQLHQQLLVFPQPQPGKNHQHPITSIRVILVTPVNTFEPGTRYHKISRDNQDIWVCTQKSLRLSPYFLYDMCIVLRVYSISIYFSHTMSCPICLRQSSHVSCTCCQCDTSAHPGNQRWRNQRGLSTIT